MGGDLLPSATPAATADSTNSLSVPGNEGTASGTEAAAAAAPAAAAAAAAAAATAVAHGAKSANIEPDSAVAGQGAISATAAAELDSAKAEDDEFEVAGRHHSDVLAVDAWLGGHKRGGKAPDQTEGDEAGVEGAGHVEETSVPVQAGEDELEVAGRNYSEHHTAEVWLAGHGKPASAPRAVAATSEADEEGFIDIDRSELANLRPSGMQDGQSDAPGVGADPIGVPAEEVMGAGLLGAAAAAAGGASKMGIGGATGTAAGAAGPQVGDRGLEFGAGTGLGGKTASSETGGSGVNNIIALDGPKSGAGGIAAAPVAGGAGKVEGGMPRAEGSAVGGMLGEAAAAATAAVATSGLAGRHHAAADSGKVDSGDLPLGSASGFLAPGKKELNVQNKLGGKDVSTGAGDSK